MGYHVFLFPQILMLPVAHQAEVELQSSHEQPSCPKHYTPLSQTPAFFLRQTLMLPVAWQAEVDLQSILVRSRPFSDAEELLPVCYRCSTTNPLLNTQARHAELVCWARGFLLTFVGTLPRVGGSAGCGCALIAV